MDNAILEKEYFLQEIKVGRIDAAETKGEIEYFLKVEYEILKIDDVIAVLKAKCKAGFKPAIMFDAKFEFNIKVGFENEIKKEEDIEENLDEVFSSLGSEISYLIAIVTKSMGGDPLIVPPLVVEYKKKK